MRVVTIDSDLCDGCGLCVKACHEGALTLHNNKAVLSNTTLCDGIGDCLPACPKNAISFIESMDIPMSNRPIRTDGCQWPIKLELVAETNPMFDGKDLLIAADCSAFTFDGVMSEFGKGGVRMIGCPKLGRVEQDKLRNIISKNDIRSVCVVRMEVPCCGPLASRVKNAVEESGKDIPVVVKVVSCSGRLVT